MWQSITGTLLRIYCYASVPFLGIFTHLSFSGSSIMWLFLYYYDNTVTYYFLKIILVFTALLCPILLFYLVSCFIYTQHQPEQSSNQPELKIPVWVFHMTCSGDWTMGIKCTGDVLQIKRSCKKNWYSATPLQLTHCCDFACISKHASWIFDVSPKGKLWHPKKAIRQWPLVYSQPAVRRERTDPFAYPSKSFFK